MTNQTEPRARSAENALRDITATALDTTLDHVTRLRDIYAFAHRALAASPSHGPDLREAALDVRRVKQAIVNVAVKHGIKPNRPHNVDTYSVASIWGYTAATPDMDAEIAAEYAALDKTAPEREP